MSANGTTSLTVPALTFGSGTHPLRVMLTKRGRAHVSGSISCSVDQLLAVAEAITAWAHTAKVVVESTGRRSRKSPDRSAASSAPAGSNGSLASSSAPGAVQPTAGDCVFGNTSSINIG